jgi:hypothetical protein
MELELDAPALVCLLLPLVLLACYRATAARSDANPYHVGGFASLLVPFVAFLNSLERRPGTPGWVFRVLNRLDARVFATTGWRLVPVAEQELCALAESLERVGERDNTVKAVRLLCAELARPPCSATGRLVVQQWVRGLLHVRRACQDYVRRHPEIHDIKIEAPLFIIGPPRTASSFLLRLLSQDPNFRCPKFWEINAPVPPPEEATYATDPRIKAAETGLASFNTISPTMLSTLRKFRACAFVARRVPCRAGTVSTDTARGPACVCGCTPRFHRR